MKSQLMPGLLAALLVGAGACGGAGGARLGQAGGFPPEPRGVAGVVPAVPPGRADSERREEPAAAPAAPPAAPDGARRDTLVRPPRSLPTETAGRAAASAASEAEPQQGQWIRVRGPQPTVRFSVRDEPLASVLQLVAAVAGRDIIPAKDVGSVLVSATVRDQPWHLGIEALLAAYDLRPVQTPSGIITVVSAERAQEAREPEPIELRHLLARDVEAALRRVVGADADSVRTRDGVEIYGDERTSRTLVVYASPEKVAQARSLVARLDRRPPSVTIEQRLVQVNRTKMQRLGLSYQLGQFRDSAGTTQPGVVVQPTGGLSSTGRAFHLLRGLGPLGTLSVEGFVDALREDGFGETETAQTITVNSDETAAIRVGDAFILPNNQPVLASGGYMPSPFTQGGGQQPAAGSGETSPGGQTGQPAGLVVGGYQEFQTGAFLQVTPYVLSASEVRMDLELVRDGGTLSPDGRSITGGRQSAYTRVTVRDGVPIVIGGLTVTGRSRTMSGIPGLSQLPLLGRLFRNEAMAEQHQDLLIIVTPHIHYEDEDDAIER
jgi:Bacterial type II and III secretion system protein/Bacterial type II/III secretion system short domain